MNPALRDFYAQSGNNTTEEERYDQVEQREGGAFGKKLFEELASPLHDEFESGSGGFEDDYYPRECNYLSQRGNMYDLPSDPIDEELVRQQLLLLSTRADQELMAESGARAAIYGTEPRFERPDMEIRERKISRGGFERSIIQEHLEGFGEKRTLQEEPDQNRKRRLCRHFLKGHCKRGKACDFLHDSSIFCPDLQKVFLGGLPAHITEASLREKLAEQGFTVINRPKVLRGFTPQVCLGSVTEAQRLIEKGKINIDGSLVDVRPYEAFAKDNLEKKLPDDIKRSVFLGGLVTGTTGQRIKDDLEKMDVKVVNHPIIKTGFSPMVTLGTVQQAQLLVKLKKVLVNDALVDVRPYVDFRKRY